MAERMYPGGEGVVSSLLSNFAGAVCAAIAAAATISAQPLDGADSYLPLEVGLRWELRSPAQATPATFEVIRKSDAGFTIRSSHPWGAADWTLSRRGDTFVMTEYGNSGAKMPLRDSPLYLDFGRNAGTKWRNSLGEFSIDSKSATVLSNGQRYENCIQIRHRAGGGNLVFVFAKGVGYVQFGEGRSAFVLDPAASNLPGAAKPKVDSPPPVRRSAREPKAGRESRRAARGIYFGLTPNTFANEELTLETMTQRFNQTVEAGSTFFVANGEWAQLEPSPGRYNLESISQMLSVTAPARLRVSYTLRIVNTIYRNVPKDLERTGWSDPKMKQRFLQLLEKIAPPLRDHTDWLLIGYEIDGYFEKHPREFADFLELYELGSKRIKELIPGVRVSSTLAYSTGLRRLRGPLAPLDPHLDFLALTYTPIKPGFTVEAPDVLPRDFQTMKEYANGRKVFFQEIAYPTASVSGGSEDRQAEFYRLAFQEFARDPAAFEAVNFMNLADLSDQAAAQYASFYGMRGHEPFKGLLQTLGLFDKSGRPKKAWEVLRSGIAAGKSTVSRP
jgi:hypothetical protein